MKTKVIKKDVIVYHNGSKIIIPIGNIKEETQIRVNELDITLLKDGVIIVEDERPYGNWGQPLDVSVSHVEGDYEKWDDAKYLKDCIDDEECDNSVPPLYYCGYVLLKEGKMHVEQYVNSELIYYTIEVVVYEPKIHRRK